MNRLIMGFELVPNKAEFGARAISILHLRVTAAREKLSCAVRWFETKTLSTSLATYNGRRVSCWGQHRCCVPFWPLAMSTEGGAAALVAADLGADSFVHDKT